MDNADQSALTTAPSCEGLDGTFQCDYEDWLETDSERTSECSDRRAGLRSHGNTPSSTCTETSSDDEFWFLEASAPSSAPFNIIQRVDGRGSVTEGHRLYITQRIADLGEGTKPQESESKSCNMFVPTRTRPDKQRIRFLHRMRQRRRQQAARAGPEGDSHQSANICSEMCSCTSQQTQTFGTSLAQERMTGQMIVDNLRPLRELARGRFSL